MSFVMIASGATRRMRIRHLRVAHLAFGATFAAVSLLGAGGVAGYRIALLAHAETQVPVVAQASVVRATPAAPSPFALEQLGRISARMFSLESRAADLGQRMAAVLPAPKAGRDAKSGTGGPMLQPAPELRGSATEGLNLFDTKLASIERKIAELADASAQRASLLMRLPTRSPINGAALVSAFGNRTDPFSNGKAFHAGLDFAAALGTPIRSSAGGRVVFAGFRPDFGWLVEIEHGNGLRTRYAHASKLLVRTGMIVTPGELIAMVGSTGRSTGPHLHYEVLHSGAPVDPKRYLAGL